VLEWYTGQFRYYDASQSQVPLEKMILKNGEKIKVPHYSKRKTLEKEL
jgi:hypothetical protein